MLINHNFSNETELKQTLDFIYAKSKEGKGFHGIMEAAFHEITIVTAIHNIKSNKGASTAGLDRKNIDYYLQMPKDQLIVLIKKEVKDYKPRPVKRVYIPKANGKKRPLGIPTMMDRIIQECLRIILEPIVEAKFYPQSYGFRPARACKDAINYITKIISTCKKNKPVFAIEGDIKGFFDNVNHKILLDKLFKIGVYDKRVIMVIKKMLEAGYFEDKKVHQTILGTPQGGILSPLLANVYLNDFDWTVGRMYQEPKPEPKLQQKIGIRTKLRRKGIIPKYLIRYADDWVILTTTEEEARRLLQYLKKYFKHKLKLELSEEKTKITDLTQKPAKFLGFNLKAEKPRNEPGKNTEGKIVGKSYPDREKVKNQVKKICKMVRCLKTCKHETMMATTINEINSIITGIAEYWKTGICTDTFNYIDHKINECAFIVFRKVYKKTYMQHKIPARNTSNCKNRHKTYNTKTWGVKVNNEWIGITRANFTHSVKTKCFFNQSRTPYSEEGRKLIEKTIGKKALDRPAIYDEETLKQYAEGNRIYNFEYLMNREYAYNRDKGKCRVCSSQLTPYDRRCHHINNSLEMNEINKVSNLAWMHHACHRLIHNNIPVDTMEIPARIMKKIIHFRAKLA